MTSIIMAIVIASAMAIIYPGPFFVYGKKMCETEILNLMDAALKNAGGEDYYLTSARKEDFFKNLNFKITGCPTYQFFPSSKKIKVNNLNFAFELDGTYIKIVRRDKQVDRVAELTADGNMQALSVVNAKVQNNAKECIRDKLSDECVTLSQPLSPQVEVIYETGYEIHDCTYEVSINVNNDVTFSNWDWLYFWSSSQHSLKRTTRSVLSHIEGWDESKGTAKIELQCEVEAKRQVVRGV